MELRKRFDPRIVFTGAFVILLAIYIIVGLQPAEAVRSYPVSAELSIPALGLKSDVTEIAPEGRTLPTPDAIVGSYSQAANKTLLIGHSTTAFERLAGAKLRDAVEYNGHSYKISKIETRQKASIDMDKILASADEDTIVLMTCAGQLLDGGDATHRLIITAVAE